MGLFFKSLTPRQVYKLSVRDFASMCIAHADESNKTKRRESLYRQVYRKRLFMFNLQTKIETILSKEPGVTSYRVHGYTGRTMTDLDMSVEIPIYSLIATDIYNQNWSISFTPGYPGGPDYGWPISSEGTVSIQFILDKQETEEDKIMTPLEEKISEILSNEENISTYVLHGYTGLTITDTMKKIEIPLYSLIVTDHNDNTYPIDIGIGYTHTEECYPITTKGVNQIQDLIDQEERVITTDYDGTVIEFYTNLKEVKVVR